METSLKAQRNKALYHTSVELERLLDGSVSQSREKSIYFNH